MASLDTAYWDRWAAGKTSVEILNYASQLGRTPARDYLQQLGTSMQQQQAVTQATAQLQAQAAAANPPTRRQAVAPTTAQAQQATLLGGVASKDKRRAGTLLTGPGGLASMANVVKKSLLGG